MNIKRLFTISGSILLAFTIILIWFLFGPTILTRAASYTVCTTGPPMCNYNSVQSAVDKAGDGDVIKVAAGTYTGINNKGGHAQVVYIDKSVTIRGGYTTTNWTISDPAANPTTLDAQGGGRVLYITGNISPTIEGLRITGGDATVLGIDNVGGLLIDDSAATVINNIIISNIGTGVGLFQGDNVSLKGNTISQNDGDGIYLNGDNVTVSGNTITHNSGDFAGGLYVDFGSNNVKIVGNTVSYNDGQGISLDGDNVTVSGNTISHHSTDWSAGLRVGGNNAKIVGNTIYSNNAIHAGGGVELGGDVEFIGNTVISNTAGVSGGGLAIHDASGVQTITGNTFTSNSSGLEGGGIHLGGGNPVLTNNFIFDNHADGYGSAINISSGSPRLLHNTIARNSGGDGSGLWMGGSTVTMTNNIIVSHTVGIYVETSGTATIDSTLWGIGAWANGTDWASDGIISTTNNLWGNPDFVDPNAGDYHIGSNSYAIDKGVDAGVTNDIDFHPRPYQAPDIGADEYWPPGALKFIYLPIIIR